MQEFLSLTGIENADKLLYTDRYPAEKAAITDLKRKYAFRLHIGKFGTVRSASHGLPRPPTASMQHSTWPSVRGSAAVGSGVLIGSLYWGFRMCSCLPNTVLYRL